MHLFCRLSVFFISLLLSVACQALQLAPTRVIINQSGGNESLMVMNKEKGASLVVVRLLNKAKDKADTGHFLISPALFRQEGDARNTVRISLMNASGLPTDRESLFYLNVQSIPSSNPLSRQGSPGYKLGGQMHVGVGYTIKLFYRPRSVNAPTSETYQLLKFTRVPGGVQVSNPTPYNITLTTISIDGNKINQPGILEPFSQKTYGTTSVQKKNATWVAINDDGKGVNGSSVIQ